MTLREYLDSIKHKTVAVVGIGVSNEPLIRMLLGEGIAVTACDKRTREQLGALAGELESLGARLQLGPDYLEGLNQDVIFRTPGLRPDLFEQRAHFVRRRGGTEIAKGRGVFHSSRNLCGWGREHSCFSGACAVACRRPVPEGSEYPRYKDSDFAR